MLPKIDKLERYFWDHTQNASDTFKLKRLIEYASFPDLIKIPFDFVKDNIESIDTSKLRTSETRIEFIKRMKEVIDACFSWDDVCYKIGGLEGDRRIFHQIQSSDKVTKS